MNIASRRSSASTKLLHSRFTICRCSSTHRGSVTCREIEANLARPQFRSLLKAVQRPWHKTRSRLIPKPVKLEYKLKPYYITTPIFYPNATPHIGHLYSLVIADIYAKNARYTRPDRRVYLVTGTDEHGMKIQKAAEERGMQPLELCDLLSDAFSHLARVAGISHTKFVRTSSQDHHRAVEKLWMDLYRSKYVYKGKHVGWYSVSDETFYTDSQVELRIDPKTGAQVKVSIETGNIVEWTEEENYKFKLSDLRNELREHFRTNPEAIYPSNQRDVIIKLVESDDPSLLPDLSISRPSSRLSWGIPVPNDPTQTIYVWLDALTSYLSGIGYPWINKTNMLQRGWPVDLQIIGKDILKFHAIYFPAFLLALGLPLPRGLLSHAHWVRDGRKMSKSIGNVVDPVAAIKTQGVDVVRWYLARVGGRFKDDVNWSDHDVNKYKHELRNLFGNLLLRMQSPKILSRLPAAFHEIPLHRRILLTRGNAASPLPAPGSPDYNDMQEDRRFGRVFGNLRVLDVAYSKELATIARDDRVSPLASGKEPRSIMTEDMSRRMEVRRRKGIVFYGDLPEASEDEQPIVSSELRDDLDKLRGRVRYHLRRHEVAEASQAIVDVLVKLNKEFTRIAPWAESTSPRDVIHLLTWSRETLRICGIMLQPFIPKAATSLLDALRVDGAARSYAFARVGAGRVRSGPPLRRILFPKEKERHEKDIRADHASEINCAKKEQAEVRQRRNYVRHARRRKKDVNPLYAPIKAGRQREPPFDEALIGQRLSRGRERRVAFQVFRYMKQRMREAIR